MFWLSLIAIIISAISLGLTIYKYYIDYKENKLKLSADLQNHFVASTRNVFEFNFVNETKYPVSITKIVLIDNHRNLKIKSLQSKTLLTEGNESSSLPINLGSYEAYKAFVVIDSDKILKSYDFEIFTSKGIFTTELSGKLPKEQSLLNLRKLTINK
ncbi:hypothetical protein AMC75_03540 [Staphylococcus carnosus]|uniref:hypothetical protein n=1 Tax=Staphylococcus carnosus TaxID=1281 RepID=UPI0006AB8E1D|nr:hypothetical protein [Staphylococcus carnosus]KOR13961.1 hypothetical protein AMC75_03540 [Staphylococcus carnosus]